MKEENKLQILFKKYIDKALSVEEAAELNRIVAEKRNREEFDRLLEDYFQNDVEDAAQFDLTAQRVQDSAWSKIENTITETEAPVSRSYFWMKIAAAALPLIIALSLYFANSPTPASTAKLTRSYDIKPGTDRATLIVGNGKKYELNGAEKEIIVEHNDIQYTDGEVLTHAQVEQNLTLTTPRGGQFRVTLSDGTKVWLNAASSLSYPASFTGPERVVRLEGEAYFEVEHDAAHPFIVIANDQKVKVLGTSFNVNAYLNEGKTVTTLLTGKVQLSHSNASVTTWQLHPGEQAVFEKSRFEVSNVDAALYSAWKDGEFRFKATPLHEALRQIERWYDLDIDYSRIPEDVHIHASISRNKQLSSVLHALERVTDLKFNVKGRSVRLMQ